MRKDLANCYQMHKTILTGFPQIGNSVKNHKGVRAKLEILYRLEVIQSKNQVFLLVQSNTMPEWTSLPRWYTLDSDRKKGILVKNIEALLPKIKNDSIFRFKVCANPTKKKFDTNKKKGIRIPIMNYPDQVKWLKRKGQQHGFQVSFLDQTIPNVSLQEQTTIQGKKKLGDKVHILTFYSAVFEGLLKVINKEKFILALKNGIGSGKSFGFGLITLAKP